jgi:hypothetical protein
MASAQIQPSDSSSAVSLIGYTWIHAPRSMPIRLMFSPDVALITSVSLSRHGIESRSSRAVTLYGVQVTIPSTKLQTYSCALRCDGVLSALYSPRMDRVSILVQSGRKCLNRRCGASEPEARKPGRPSHFSCGGERDAPGWVEISRKKRGHTSVGAIGGALVRSSRFFEIQSGASLKSRASSELRFVMILKRSARVFNRCSWGKTHQPISATVIHLATAILLTQSPLSLCVSTKARNCPHAALGVGYPPFPYMPTVKPRSRSQINCFFCSKADSSSGCTPCQSQYENGS